MFGLAWGYEALNDHDHLRRDQAIALAVGVEDVTGEDRSRERDQGSPLAGKSTLNRLEWGWEDSAADRYKKISVNTSELDELLGDCFQSDHSEEPKDLVWDVEATDIPLSGEPEGRFDHGDDRNDGDLPI